MTQRGRIDTHQHIVPPDYGRWLALRGISPLTPEGGAVPNWTVEDTSEFMDDNRISTGILSVSTPGVHAGNDAEARIRAREVNEFTAEIVSRHPDRFGFFATLTLPDVIGAIAEADYAFSTSKADGVVLLGNVRGTYFGDPSWDPLMEELDSRKAVVFVHPSELASPKVPGIPPYSGHSDLCFLHYEASERMSTTTDVRTALYSGELFLEYQPVVSLQDARCVGGEALIRWRRGTRIIPPQDFIPMIEDTPVSGLVTYWVIDTVAKELGAWLGTLDNVH